MFTGQFELRWPTTDRTAWPRGYEYKPLEEAHIRILHLQPVGTQSDSLVAEISSEELVEGIVGYAALSWEWGSEKPNEIIRIKNKNDDKSKISSLMLKPNLLKALQRLRKSDEVVRLWVDALCINQARDDNQEKSEQIAMVTKIYGMAEQVCVWLGEERDESTKAIEYIHQLVQLEDDNHIAALENNNIFNASRLVPLTKFLKRGWFSRRWVVQVSKRTAKRCVIYILNNYPRLGNLDGSRSNSILWRT